MQRIVHFRSLRYPTEEPTMPLHYLPRKIRREQVEAERIDPVIAEVEAADEVDEFCRRTADEELREPVEVW